MDFHCINVCQVPKEMLKSKAEHFPDPLTVVVTEAFGFCFLHLHGGMAIVDA